jgi:hypothetical protein
MDPFTGHETKGNWPEEYQKIFLNRALELYKPFVMDYNKLIKDLNVEILIGQYIASMEGHIPNKDLRQFEKDVKEEFRPL